MRLALGKLGLIVVLWPLGQALAVEPQLAPHAPLTIPTPDGPKLRLPDIAPPPPSLMLEHRPLRVPPKSAGPTLNRFPGVESGAFDGGDSEVPDPDGEPRIRLEH